MVDVVLIKVDVGKLGSGPIPSDGVVFFEDTEQVASMAFFGVFDTKVIDNEEKLNRLDRAPCVVSKTQCGGHVVVAGCVESISKEFVGENPQLWEIVGAFADFEVDPIIVNKV